MYWLIRRYPRNVLIAVTGAVAVADALLRAVVFAHGHNWILGYHLAWLRFDELLIGSFVGSLGDRARIVPGWLRTLSVVFILAVISRARYPGGWLYYGGMTALSLATAFVVAPTPVRGWWGHRVLSLAPVA